MDVTGTEPALFSGFGGIGCALPEIAGQKPLSLTTKHTVWSASAKKKIFNAPCYLGGRISIVSTAGAGVCTIYDGDPDNGGIPVAYEPVGAAGYAHIDLGGAIAVIQETLWIELTVAGKVTVLMNG